MITGIVDHYDWHHRSADGTALAGGQAISVKDAKWYADAYATSWLAGDSG